MSQHLRFNCKTINIFLFVNNRRLMVRSSRKYHLHLLLFTNILCDIVIKYNSLSNILIARFHFVSYQYPYLLHCITYNGTGTNTMWMFLYCSGGGNWFVPLWCVENQLQDTRGKIRKYQNVYVSYLS